MKKQYIKFIEGNQESLDKACKLAEKHGYIRRIVEDAINFKWQWILRCDDNGDYYTSSCTEEEFINDGYTELKEEIEWVYVSNEHGEDALEHKRKRILITTLPWNANMKYLCVVEWYEEAYINWNEYLPLLWKYAVPVLTEEKKERKLMMTDSEWEKFQNIINKQ